MNMNEPGLYKKTKKRFKKLKPKELLLKGPIYVNESPSIKERLEKMLANREFNYDNSKDDEDDEY